jgi:4-hydroxybenzoyl-CoA reductase subunit beta
MTALPAFQLLRPASLSEAVAARHRYPAAALLAGGTDLVPNLRHGLRDAPVLIDITGLPGLRDIAAEPAGLRIGAGVTLERLSHDPLIAAHAPALAVAARAVGGPAHRAAGTLGGNLCLDTRCIHYNESAWWRQSNDFCLKYRGERCHIAPAASRCHAAYSGDTAAVLLVLGATIEVGGESGTRWAALDSLFHEDGAAHLRLGDDEVLLGVRLPVDPAVVAGYEKARPRGAIDFPLAGVAVALRREHGLVAHLRIAITGTNSRPILLTGCEALLGLTLDDRLLERIEKLVQKQVKPMRTTLTPAHCRRRLAAAMAARLARRLWQATPA